MKQLLLKIGIFLFPLLNPLSVTANGNSASLPGREGHHLVFWIQEGPLGKGIKGVRIFSKQNGCFQEDYTNAEGLVMIPVDCETDSIEISVEHRSWNTCQFSKLRFANPIRANQRMKFAKIYMSQAEDCQAQSSRWRNLEEYLKNETAAVEKEMLPILQDFVTENSQLLQMRSKEINPIKKAAWNEKLETQFKKLQVVLTPIQQKRKNGRRKGDHFFKKNPEVSFVPTPIDTSSSMNLDSASYYLDSIPSDSSSSIVPPNSISMEDIFGEQEKPKMPVIPHKGKVWIGFNLGLFGISPRPIEGKSIGPGTFTILDLDDFSKFSSGTAQVHAKGGYFLSNNLSVIASYRKANIYLGRGPVYEDAYLSQHNYSGGFTFTSNLLLSKTEQKFQGVEWETCFEGGLTVFKPNTMAESLLTRISTNTPLRGFTVSATLGPEIIFNYFSLGIHNEWMYFQYLFPQNPTQVSTQDGNIDLTGLLSNNIGFSIRIFYPLRNPNK